LPGLGGDIGCFTECVARTSVTPLFVILFPAEVFNNAELATSPEAQD
jgi:hypothetical protein